MPAAIYTISHKATRRVLAVISLERKELTDAAAWEGFRKELVGDDKLMLPTFGVHPVLAIPTDHLAVDEVDSEAVTRSLYDDPYAYEVSKTAEAPEPGDGTLKTLTTPGNIATPKLFVTGNKLEVTLANMPTDPTPVWIVFEGEGPKSVTITAPNNKATFSITRVLVLNAEHRVLVLATGSPVFAGVVTVEP